MIYIARLDTPNFEFIAVGSTAVHAVAAMRDGWAKHRRQTGAFDTWAEVRDDVMVTGPIHPGTALRDGGAFSHTPEGA